MKTQFSDSRKESFFKAISWRILASLTTFSVVFTLTDNLSISTITSIIEMLLKILLYYAHERAWLIIVQKFHFNKKINSSDSIVDTSS